MKIGVNVYSIKYPATGMGQYILHLVNTFAKLAPQNEYTILKPYTPPHHIHAVSTWAKRKEHVEQVVWEQFTAPAVANKAGVDIYHVPYFAPPLIPRTPTVVTIPDLIHLHLPLYLEGLLKKTYMSLNIQATHQAKLIITFSQHSKQDIVDLLKLPPEHIRVVYLAAGDEYHPITDQEELAAVRMRYGLDDRYIFYLGGLDQRKNVTQLVRAFADLSRRLAEPKLKLFIAGNPDKQIGPKSMFPDPRPVAAEMGVTDQIVYRFVEEQDKAALYSGAEVFVYPSMYEGFGLPPLEAMKCGAPVVCSNRTSLPEVVGDAALSVDPDDTQALADALYTVLTNNSVRADLSRRSLQRATHFSWDKVATETLAVYKEVLGQ